MISRTFFELRTPAIANRSDQIRQQDQCKCSEPFSLLISRKDIGDQISKIRTLLRRLKDASLIQVPAETSLRRVNWVSLTYVPVSTSLRRLRLTGFFYVQVRRCENVSNRSVLLTYQLRRRDDISAWSRTFKLVNKVDQFLLGNRQYVFRHLQQFSLIRVPASTSLQRLEDVGLIKVLVVTTLPCAKLVHRTRTSLRCLKLVGFISVPMRRHKDITNRSISLTYQLRRLNDV